MYSPKGWLRSKKKIFSKYKVVKFQTRENIIDAFIVIFFESSAIVDAILLNKKIITIFSNYVDENVKNASNIYNKKVGLHQINIEDNLDESFDNLIEKLNIAKKNYINFKQTYIAPDGNKIGYEKIIKKIRYYFF